MRFSWECHAADHDTDYISTLKDVVVRFYDIDDELQNCTLQIDLCYADNKKLVRDDEEFQAPALTGIAQTLVGYDNNFKIKVNRTSFLCDRRKFCFWVHCIVDHIRYNWFLSPFQAVTQLNRKRKHTETELLQTTSLRLSDQEDDLQEFRQQLQSQQLQIQVLTSGMNKLILQTQNLNTNIDRLMLLYQYMTTPMTPNIS